MKLITEQMIEAATKELNDKTLRLIQKETALKWASRAIATSRFAIEHSIPRESIDYYEYKSEALEHAAQVEEDGFVDKLRKEIDEY